MKKLLLGNEAIARGVYEAPRSTRPLLRILKSIPNGRLMKRLQLKSLSVQQSVVRAALPA